MVIFISDKSDKNDKNSAGENFGISNWLEAVKFTYIFG